MTNKEIMYHALTKYAMETWDYSCTLYEQADNAYNHGDTEQGELLSHRARVAEDLGFRIDDLAQRYA